MNKPYSSIMLSAKASIRVALCTVPLRVSISRQDGDLPIVPKIAIVSLLKWMTKFGYSADFYDVDMLLPSENEMFAYFKAGQYDVVGLSAVVSTSYQNVKRMAKMIREACPSALIVLGGNMAATANTLLRKTEVDICALGDGEKAWVSLLDYATRNHRTKNAKELLAIKGIAFLNEQDEMEFTGYGDSIPDGENPFPDYELLSQGLLSHGDLVENYFREGKKCNWFLRDPRTFEPHRKRKIAALWTSKGCVARCTFCQRFAKGYHVFSIEKLDEHLATLKEKYDVGFIMVADENFGSDKKHARAVALLFKKHDMLWFAGGVRCTNVTLDDLRFFKECGCTGLKFGVESGSQRILDVMEKRFTVDNLYGALKNAYACGMWTPLSFCIGMPGESNETVVETGCFIGKVARMLGIPPTSKELGDELFWALPLPGAPLYEYGRLNGLIGTSADEEEAYLISTSDRGVSKNNFLNLTGMSIRDVLFWDFLIYYEAMRVFYPVSLDGKSGTGNSPRGKHARKMFTIKNALRVLRMEFQPVSALNVALSRSRFATKIPSSVLYPMMRNLLYAEHVLFGRRNMKVGHGCKPLVKYESLREINRKIRDSLPSPSTLTEKNQQILRLGR